MEIITQAVRVIDYENDRIQKRNVNEMPKFRDYIEQFFRKHRHGMMDMNL